MQVLWLGGPAGHLSWEAKSLTQHVCGPGYGFTHPSKRANKQDGSPPVSVVQIVTNTAALNSQHSVPLRFGDPQSEIRAPTALCSLGAPSGSCHSAAVAAPLHGQLPCTGSAASSSVRHRGTPGTRGDLSTTLQCLRLQRTLSKQGHILRSWGPWLWGGPSNPQGRPTV